MTKDREMPSKSPRQRPRGDESQDLVCKEAQRTQIKFILPSHSDTKI